MAGTLIHDSRNQSEVSRNPAGTLKNCAESLFIINIYQKTAGTCQEPIIMTLDIYQKLAGTQQEP